MNRSLLLIASRHAAVALALHQYIDLLFPICELNHRVEHIGFSSSAELFERLDGYQPEQLQETMVLFDIGAEGGGAWKVSDMRSERGLAAQLVMSYPEVYFVFLYNKSDAADSFPFMSVFTDKEILRRHHFVGIQCLHEMIELVRVHAQGFRTIFDATGLRSLVKQTLLDEVGTNISKIYRPLLESRLAHVAAAADEEIPFVYLNGYLAYQAGFRSWLLSTKSEFSRILGRTLHQDEDRDNTDGCALKSISRISGPETFEIVLSDWDLAFSDDQEKNERDDSLLETPNLLREDERVILITGFFKAAQEQLLLTQKGFRTPKPYGGLFKLLMWESPHGNPLKDRYDEAWSGIIADEQKEPWHIRVFKPVRKAARSMKRVAIEQATSKSRALTAWISNKLISFGFNQHPAAPGTLINSLTPAPVHSPLVSKHSAPYARSVVARRLLWRAKRIMAAEVLDTEAAVQVAVLAGEAKEILGGMSRTTAYDAVTLQNEAEVGAEVSFLGMSAKIEVKQRLEKLKQEGRIVQWVGHTAVPGGNGTSKETRRESTEALLNFLLYAVKSLRLRFSEHEQMEAAEECLRDFAEHQYHLMTWKPILPFVRKLSERYLISATKAGTSVLRLLVYCIIWIVFFGFIYFALLLSHPKFMAQPAQAEPVANSTSSNVRTDAISETGISSPSDKDTARSNPFDNSSKLRNKQSQQLFGSQDRHYNCFAIGMWHSFFTFFELQPGLPDVDQFKMEQAHDNSSNSRLWVLSYRLVMLIELIVAYLHLGLLISVLYRRLTRRAP